KMSGYNVELAREVIKRWAYQNISPQSFDQYYLFGKQTREEDLLLNHGVDLVVSDSPVLMQAAYAKRYGVPRAEHLIDVALEFEKKFPSLNIFLDRTGIDYQQQGRFENEEEARQMDEMIRDILP